MSLAAKFIPIQTPKSLAFQSNQLPFSNYRSSRFISDFYDCLKSKRNNVNGVRMKALTNLSQHKSISSPVSIELKPVLTETQFDRLIAESEESVIIIWIANWCRKCIYLKPKLEKLAADFHPRVMFYCIDVNNVPYKLVVRAGVTLWKDSKKQAEVIGGHKAYLVVNEVREMIEDEDQP